MSVVSGRKEEGEGSLAVQVASTLSTIPPSLLSRLLMNLLFECGPKNGTRREREEEEEERGRKKATSPGKKMRWKIEGNHDSRLVSWNCIANGRSFNGGIMHDRFSMAHC